jgi:hypothetical protein
MKMTAGASCDEDSKTGSGVELWFLRKWVRWSKNAVCEDMALLVSISNDYNFFENYFVIYYLLYIMFLILFTFEFHSLMKGVFS